MYGLLKWDSDKQLPARVGDTGELGEIPGSGIYPGVGNGNLLYSFLKLIYFIYLFYLLQDGLVGSPGSPTDSQESSPAPQFKSINSSVLSFLHSPTLTSIHDYWKNHSLD